jgi:hypothetical protein
MKKPNLQDYCGGMKPFEPSPQKIMARGLGSDLIMPPQ